MLEAIDIKTLLIIPFIGYISKKLFEDKIYNPIRKYGQLIEKTKYLMEYYKKYYHNIHQLKDYDNEQVISKIYQAKEEFRSLACEIGSYSYGCMCSRKKKEKIELLKKNLIGISNSFFGDEDDVRDAREFEEEIVKIINEKRSENNG